VTLKGQTRDPQYAKSAISRKLLELETSIFVCSFVSGMPSRCTNNFPESGRGLGNVSPTIFGSTVGYPSDSLASCYFSELKPCRAVIVFDQRSESSLTVSLIFSAGLHS